MAAGVAVTTNANAWVVTYASSAAAGYTLPFKLWPFAAEKNRSVPFLPKRIVWNSGDLGAATNKAIIQDNAGNDYVLLIATGADYEAPQEWKRAKDEAGPIGAVITEFDSGEMIIYF